MSNAPDREPKVMVATALGAGKDYCRSFLCPILAGLQGTDQILLLLDGVDAEPLPGRESVANLSVVSLPPFDGDTSAPYYRIAAMREWARQAFLSSDCTHLYFHDADMLPPSDIIPRLLALRANVASGLYNLRNAENVQPALDPPSHRPTCATAAFNADRVGMGCCLMARHALEGTPFRFDGATGEDYLWCDDARTSGLIGAIAVDPVCSCGHVREDATASRILVEPEEIGVMWSDTPHYIHNRFGSWERGVMRFDLTPEQAATLGAGFIHDHFARLSLEVKPISTILSGGN